MYSQRKKERRSKCGKTTFPIITRGGSLIENDRRHTPDRRLNSIQVELVDAEDHSFPDYLPKK